MEFRLQVSLFIPPSFTVSSVELDAVTLKLDAFGIDTCIIIGMVWLPLRVA